VILDQRGESMSSSSFAGRLQGWRHRRNKAAVVFIVGGHDGLAAETYARTPASPIAFRGGRPGRIQLGPA